MGKRLKRKVYEIYGLELDEPGQWAGNEKRALHQEELLFSEETEISSGFKEESYQVSVSLNLLSK